MNCPNCKQPFSAPPIEPVGMREALERCLTEMKKTAISIRKEAGYKAVHCDFIGAIEQAQAALQPSRGEQG